MNKNITVVQYAVARLSDLGIKHIFGVPGDYSFPIDDAITYNPNFTFVISSNELNASYAADGYARLSGAAIITTTYGVGELSALNGIMGSLAESLPVFHLVGCPSTRITKARRPMHHTLGDGEYGQFFKLSAAACCASTLLTPQNTISEMERVISTALIQRKPALIEIQQDYANMEVIGESLISKPFVNVLPVSIENELDGAVKTILSKISQAQNPIALLSFKLQRYGIIQKAIKFLETYGIAFVTSPGDKGIISETHPLYLGIYNGVRSTENVRQTVEAADLVLDLGGVIFFDLNSGFSSDHLTRESILSITPDTVILGAAKNEIQSFQNSFSPVWMGDVLDILAVKTAKKFDVKITPPTPLSITGDAQSTITYNSFGGRLQQNLKPNDILFIETGNASILLSKILLPENCVYYNQTLWGSIGWATPAAFGAALAAPERRVILVTGDGSHQMTANDIGVMGRYGVKPIIIVLNNDLYGIEEYLEGNNPTNDEYNKIALWQYAKIPEVMGCVNWNCSIVKTNAELEAALEGARNFDGASYIQVVLDPALIPALSEEEIEKQYQLKPPSIGIVE